MLRRLWVLPLVTGLALGCLATQPGPEAAANQWIEAVQHQDARQLSQLTCDADQVGLEAGVSPGTGWNTSADSALTGAHPRVRLDELQYQTVRNDGATADVRVTGQLHSTLLGAVGARDIKLTMYMKHERNAWRYCGNISATTASLSGR